ncbi:MAG: TolB protein [Desulfobacteraceae bacterium Eth-SRB1]|nr:MAG: TolB protein [Desulfobacteraceae bacterium Eth-SRB1]
MLSYNGQRNLGFNIIGLIAVIHLFFIGPALCQAGYDYIDINNPFLRKIPIAIPLFKTVSESPVEKRMSNKSSDLLSETLKFTGYFKILDQDAFLVDPEKSGIIASNINFQNWTSIGAELLITGGLQINGDIVEMELRLYDPFKGRLLVGKKYKGRISDQRKIIRRFCSEVIYIMTGKRGIFDSKIAFISTGSGNKEIYICEFDGNNPVQKTRTKNITLSPAWSSDGKWIAYTAYKRGKPDLYIEHLKEKRGVVVAKKGINITPAWVPGKFALAATLSYSGDPEIYMLTGTGKIIKRLTYNMGIDVSPVWSPDGAKMAFVSNRSGTPQIYILDIESRKVARLTFHGRYNTSPSWSPDGDRIAYAAMKNGQFNIYVISADGGDPIQLTYNEGDSETPSWSPDGSLIVFSSTREGASRLYVMTSYGTDQRRLLALPGEQTSPRWSPNCINN